MKKSIVVLHACGGLLFFGGSLPASQLLSSSGSGSTSVSALDAYIGYSFTVGGSSLTASALGLFDQDLNGFSEAHNVCIWTSSGTCISSATVPAGSLAPLQGEFRYTQLPAPVTLVSGQTYVIAANYPSQVDWFIANESAQAYGILSPYATLGQAATRVGPGVPLLGGGYLFAGPNIEFTLVPEPSSVALTVGGILALLALRNIGSGVSGGGRRSASTIVAP
jgi:hypothetical protein